MVYDHPEITELIYFLLDNVNFATLEFNLPVCFCKESVVSAHADIVAGEEFGSALAYDYRACRDGLPAKKF